MASDWLACVLPAIQMPGLKILTWESLSNPGPWTNWPKFCWGIFVYTFLKEKVDISSKFDGSSLLQGTMWHVFWESSMTPSLSSLMMIPVIKNWHYGNARFSAQVSKWNMIGSASSDILRDTILHDYLWITTSLWKEMLVNRQITVTVCLLTYMYIYIYIYAPLCREEWRVAYTCVCLCLLSECTKTQTVADSCHSRLSWGGGYSANFIRSVIFPNFLHFQNTL